MALTETRTALLTGTNRGTGRAIAAALHEVGWRVLSLNRTLSGESWLGEIQCDLSDPSDLEAGIAQACRGIDRLDACVFNAAVRRLSPIATLPPADMTASVLVNLIAPFRLTQATLPLLRRTAGVLVFMGSHAGTRFFEGGAAYCATKAALKALVEVLLLEERPQGVRTVLVSPGAIANRAYDDSVVKMSVQSVGRFVAKLITEVPSDIVVGEIEIRPTRLASPTVTGIDRLQSV